MLSFAPDSPRNDKGSSLTPSYTTPLGNMDWLVMPKMKVRKLVYPFGLLFFHIAVLVSPISTVIPKHQNLLFITAFTLLSPATSVLSPSLNCSRSTAEQPLSISFAPSISAPDSLTIAICTSTNPASELSGSRPHSNARISRRLSYSRPFASSTSR
jgi:hypothetical protein